MPAPRNCRACGAALPADVRWCLRCYTPATEFTPRAPIHEGGIVGQPRHDVRTSRTKASATTFGVVGRLAITAIVAVVWVDTLLMVVGGAILLLPFLAAWSVLSVAVLRHVWKAVPVDDGYEPGRFRLRDVWEAGVSRRGRG